MADYKIISQKKIDKNSTQPVELYTVPVNKQTIASFLTVNNMTNATAEFTLYLVPNGQQINDSNVVHIQLPVDELDSYLADKGLTMGEGDKLYITGNLRQGPGTTVYTASNENFEIKLHKVSDNRLWAFILSNNKLHGVAFDYDTNTQTLARKFVTLIDSDIKLFDYSENKLVVVKNNDDIKIYDYAPGVYQDQPILYDISSLLGVSNTYLNQHSRLVKVDTDKYMFVGVAGNNTANERKGFVILIKIDEYPRKITTEFIALSPDEIEYFDFDVVSPDMFALFYKVYGTTFQIRYLYQIDWNNMTINEIDSGSESISTNYIAFRIVRQYDGINNAIGILTYQDKIRPIEIDNTGFVTYGTESTISGLSGERTMQTLRNNNVAIIFDDGSGCWYFIVEIDTSTLAFTAGSLTQFTTTEANRFWTDYRESDDKIVICYVHNSNWDFRMIVGDVDIVTKSITFGPQYTGGTSGTTFDYYAIQPKFYPTGDYIILYQFTNYYYWFRVVKFDSATNIISELSTSTETNGWFRMADWFAQVSANNTGVGFILDNDRLIVAHGTSYNTSIVIDYSLYDYNYHIYYNQRAIPITGIDESYTNHGIENVVGYKYTAIRKYPNSDKVAVMYCSVNSRQLYFQTYELVDGYLRKKGTAIGGVLVPNVSNVDSFDFDLIDDNTILLAWNDNSVNSVKVKRLTINADYSLTDLDPTPLDTGWNGSDDGGVLISVLNSSQALLAASPEDKMVVIDFTTTPQFDGPYYTKTLQPYLRQVFFSNRNSANRFIILGQIWEVKGNLLYFVESIIYSSDLLYVEENDRVYIAKADGTSSNVSVYNKDLTQLIFTNTATTGTYVRTLNRYGGVKNGVFYALSPSPYTSEYYLDETLQLFFEENIGPLSSITNYYYPFRYGLNSTIKNIADILKVGNYYIVGMWSGYGVTSNDIRKVENHALILYRFGSDGTVYTSPYQVTDVKLDGNYLSTLNATSDIDIAKIDDWNGTTNLFGEYYIEYSATINDTDNIVLFETNRSNKAISNRDIIVTYETDTDQVKLTTIEDTGTALTLYSIFNGPLVPSLILDTDVIDDGTNEFVGIYYKNASNQLEYVVYSYDSGSDTFTQTDTGILSNFVQSYVRVLSDDTRRYINFDSVVSMSQEILYDTTGVVSKEGEVLVARFPDDIIAEFKIEDVYLTFSKEQAQLKYFIGELNSEFVMNIGLYGVEL